MATSEADIKRLWGLAAGRCSEPTCGRDCIRFLNPIEPTVIGEMAHVIASSPDGPRGRPEGGLDTYENLILLCPTHHRIVDKAPGTHSVELLHEWKRQHEEGIRRRLEPRVYHDKTVLCTDIAKILAESYAVWKQTGPESDVAERNPMSNVAGLWTFRKLAEIIPNNTKISNMLRANSTLFTIGEYEDCSDFFIHATALEQSAYARIDTVPRFPLHFQEMIMRIVSE